MPPSEYSKSYSTFEPPLLSNVIQRAYRVIFPVVPSGISVVRTPTSESVYQPANAVLKGHTFNGWYSDENCTQAVTTFGGGSVGDITLYAKLTANTYDVWMDGSEAASATVTFDLNGASGTAPAAQTVTETDTLTYPEVPERSGYVFGGWYANKDCEGELYDFSGLVGGDITLYAKWVKTGSADGGVNNKRDY